MRTAFVVVLALFALSGAVPAGADPYPAGPQIFIVTPGDPGFYYQGQAVRAGYVCLAGYYFPVITCEGDVPVGGYLDTSTSGWHTFTVHAVDYAGAEATLTTTYIVFDVIAPTATITSPAAGAVYAVGAQLFANYSCDDPKGSGVVGCIGSAPNGYPLPTNQPGTFSFTVDAYDAAANHGTASVSYTVADVTPPQVTIVSPADGAVYHVGDAIAPSYFCHDDVEGSNVACKATAIDTSLGTHTFRVNSVDSSGNAAFATATYSVRYDFDGFYSPLVAEPATVTVKAGEPVPVKFSLHGDRGLDVISRTAWHPCGSRDDATTASGTLTYNANLDRYTYAWTTSKSWAGTCTEFLLTLRDGTTHAAYVSLR